MLAHLLDDSWIAFFVAGLHLLIKSNSYMFTVKHGYSEHAYNELMLTRSDFHSPTPMTFFYIL